MNSFEFHAVPHVIVEPGAAARLGAILSERYPQRRVCVVTDAFLLKSGLLDPTLDSLRTTGWNTCVISNVVADPPDAVVMDAVSRARAHGAEVIVGLGGGSSMDVAKLLAVLTTSQQPLAEMYGVGKVVGQRLPLVQVPTTAGTGSEMTGIAIVTTGATTKSGVVAPQLYADIAVLDATLTIALPRQATAATGIDAIVHAIEAYTSKIRKNALSDALALQALRLLAGNLLRACDRPDDIDARQAMLVGAMLAGQAFANAPVGAVHALAYPLGGRFHVAHGLSNSLVLPHVLRHNAGGAIDLYAQLAPVIIPEAQGSPQARVEALILWAAELSQRCGIAGRLRDVGVREEDIDTLAADAMQQTRLLVNNPVDVSVDDARRIYREAL